MSIDPAHQRLPSGLYALCDDGVRPDVPLVEKARQIVAGGARVLQLRMKRTPPREAIEAARAVVALCSDAGALCLVNDRADYAHVAGAHGVHLGDDDLPPEEARRLLPAAVIGVTVRTLEQARAAFDAGADYVGVGPIFETRTKQVAHAQLGIEGLQAIAARAPVPVVAIAGITLANIEAVAAAGAHATAVASGLLLAPNIAEQARLLNAAFERGRARHSIRATP